MMWGMMLVCAVPLIIIAFIGSGVRSSTLLVVLGLGGMVLLHWVVMKVLHRGHQDRHQPPPAAFSQDATSQSNDHPHVH